jgi:hypothetical protein
VPYESVSSDSWIGSAGFISAFLGYIFLPLLPLIVAGAFSFRATDCLTWVAVCTFLSYWPVLLPRYSMLWWFRWAILLVYPLVFISVEGVWRLWTLGRNLVWRLKVGRVLALSVLLLNLVMSSYYLTALPENQIKYFGEWNRYERFIQTSMLQNSVSLSDMRDVADAMKWLDQVAGSSTVLVLHEAMADWARILIPKFEIVRVAEIEISSPMRRNVATRLVQLAAEKAATNKAVYTVWWVDGKGWYGMPELPPQFTEIRRFGNMGVYQYRASPRS